MHELKQSLEAQGPILSDRLQALAEANRTLVTGHRGLERDSHLVEVLTEKCEHFASAMEEQDKERSALSTQLRMAEKMLQAADGTSFIARDVRALSWGSDQLRQVAPSFVQLASTSGDSADEFAAELLGSAPSPGAVVANAMSLLAQDHRRQGDDE